MLLALMINAETLESQVPPRPIMRLDRSGQENRTLHAQVLHPVLHHRELQRDNASNLDSAAERNLPITLRKMQVTDAEFGTFDMHR